MGADRAQRIHRGEKGLKILAATGCKGGKKQRERKKDKGKGRAFAGKGAGGEQNVSGQPFTKAIRSG